ncbi:MAG TPA: thioredoxin family protein [Ktedonobacteraceae bacterium]
MTETITRLGILVLVGLTVWLFVWMGRRFVERQRQQALAAAPFGALSVQGNAVTHIPAASSPSPIRILAFSSPDCHQCHRLQTPALQRVVEARGEAVTFMEVDATIEHELARTYHVLTVPSTVVLDAKGNACAINYGFANTQRLLKQVDETLAS